MLVSISPFLYGTLNPEPKSINDNCLNFLAVLNRISDACKKTSISKISLQYAYEYHLYSF